MSDIQKKTLPPGSWPGSKGGAKTAETSSEAGGQGNVPRSAASPPQLSKEQEDRDESITSSAASQGEGEGGYYTHQKEKGQQEQLDDITEEAGSRAETTGTGEGEGEIKMHDTEEREQSLKDVEPEPISQEQEPEQEGQEEATPQTEAGQTETGQTDEAQSQIDDLKSQAQSQAQTQTEQQPAGTSVQDEGGTDEVASKTSSGGSSKLTEQAKKVLDLASQGQPTDEARESFIQSAKEEDEGVSGITGQPQSEFPQEQTETAPSELQSVAQTAGEEGRPQSTTGGKTVSFKSPSESQTQGSTTEGEEAAITGTGTGTGTGTQTQPSESQFDEGGQTQLGTEQPPQQDQPEQEGEGAPPESTAGVTVPDHLDFSILKDGTVNKGGNIVDSSGKVVGRVVQGILQYLVNKKCDENGDIWSENGKVIGKAEPITDSERDDMMKEPAPFESFEDAVVDGNGMVVSNGEWVGKVVEGDLKTLRGRPVDKDGDILDKGGNVIGRAERWEPEPEPEPEAEPEVDKSLLAGKRVNKAGNVVDSSGNIYGRVVEGDPKKMVGRMCDKNGNVLSESGDVIGKAELIPEGEREGMKEGPFAELTGCTVAKDGTVVTPSGDIVGRLVSGDPKMLFGRSIDEDGDVLDRNGNVIGKAERWEPEAVEKKKNPMSGRRVNREANVLDEDGNVIGKLTSGDPRICSGKEIDDDGDVVDGKGTVIGHCSLLEDIPAEEEESPEDKAKREQAEQDKKLAIQMAVCVEQCLDKIRPICKMITEKIDKAERTPEEERDEEALVREVRPLIEEGGRILTEAKGVIKGLDPDGRISANAKHKTAAREATPEEYHLADVLKDLTGDVTQCIENAKKKLEDMPHAKKELNPLWGLLNEPLFQILAAVGLLLSGVLGLVGRLLSGLGLGGLLDGLLGTLGINRVLEGLGIGSLTGGDKKKKKSGGGLLGGVLGG